MVKNIKIIVEKHADGYVAYPVGLKGVVVAEGDTYEEAFADAKSAIEFHIETFGGEVLEEETAASEIFIAVLIQKVASLLRGDPARAAEARKRLLQILGEEPQSGLKALLESAPLEGIDLTRIRDLGRDVEL